MAPPLSRQSCARSQFAPVLLAQNVDRGKLELTELDLRALRLNGKPSLLGSTVEPMVDHVPVNPDLDLVPNALDPHTVPFANRLFRIIGKVRNPAGLALDDPPVLLGSASTDHVGHENILDDAPEVPRMLVVHLYFDRLGKHLVEVAQLGGMNQHPAISRLARKAVLRDHPVVLEFLIRQKMPARRTQADQHPIARNEGFLPSGFLSRAGTPSTTRSGPFH